MYSEINGTEGNKMSKYELEQKLEAIREQQFRLAEEADQIRRFIWQREQEEREANATTPDEV
jgi:2-methylcitrate dehydratase PrpD